jgi:SAM-dependent methyltransferase
MGKRVGLGMNKFELAQNKQLSEYVAQNLNKNPQFPFPDNTFDVVTCVVSIDYLNKPLEIFKEVRRVLKPGGRFIVSQSNRCFPTKAIQIWLNTNVRLHLFTSNPLPLFSPPLNSPTVLPDCYTSAPLFQPKPPARHYESLPLSAHACCSLKLTQSTQHRTGTKPFSISYPSTRGFNAVSLRIFQETADTFFSTLCLQDMEHIFIIGSYFHYAGGFTPAAAFDISPSRGALFGSDPMYIIQGEKA